MTESIIVAVITGLCAIVGSIITGRIASDKTAQQLAISQAITDTKIVNLTEEVKKHNNFAARMPVVEEQIKVINHRLEDLERKAES